MIFKIIVTVVFVLTLIVHTLTDIKVDNTTIILIVLALIPWIIQYIKSFEINGVGKVELINREEKEKIRKAADSAGLAENKGINYSQYTFYNLREQDPKLALAGLRIEIENKLRSIAEKEGIKNTNAGIRQLTNILNESHTIDNNEAAVIRDLIGILNKAVHSQMQEYDDNSFDWVFNLGLKLLNSLEFKSKI